MANNLEPALSQRLAELPAQLHERRQRLLAAARQMPLGSLQESGLVAVERTNALRAVVATGVVASVLQQALDAGGTQVPVMAFDIAHLGPAVTMPIPLVNDGPDHWRKDVLASSPPGLHANIDAASVALVDGLHTRSAEPFLRDAAYLAAELKYFDAIATDILEPYATTLEASLANHAQRAPQNVVVAHRPHVMLLKETHALLHEALEVTTEVLRTTRTTLGEDITSAALGTIGEQMTPEHRAEIGERVVDALAKAHGGDTLGIARSVSREVSMGINQALGRGGASNSVRSL